MKILAIDTSASACSVALLIDDETIATHTLAPMQQAKLILPTIDELMRSKNIHLNQLDALAFGCGPGSFTGARIATSVMQGLGFATGLPLILVSSLAALAQAAFYDLGWKKLITCVDARIQEVYTAAYQVNQQGFVELIDKEAVCAPNEIAIPHGNDWYGVGNGWEIYRSQISFTPLQIDVTRLPTAFAVAQLAKVKYAKGELTAPHAALPVYLRNEVAMKARK